MDKITTHPLTEFEVYEIIKITYENILLELHFNIISASKKLSFSLGISDDGETIIYNNKTRWITLSDLDYEVYSVSVINQDELHCDLTRILNKKIKDIKYGIGKLFNSNDIALYYFMISTDEEKFLFFNNGDQGAYSFDKIEEILANDIYDYQWTNKF